MTFRIITLLAFLVVALGSCQTHDLSVDPFAPFAIPVEPGPGPYLDE